MRVILHLSKNKVPISNPRSHALSRLHKWFGRNNEIHNEQSFYTFSDIWGKDSTSKDGVLDFPNGGKFVFSSNDTGLISKILFAIDQDSEFIFGMKVIGRDYVVFDPSADFGDYFLFQSPIHLTQKSAEIGSKNKSITFKDTNSSDVMTHIMKLKMDKAGVNSEGFSIAFDTKSPSKRTHVWKHSDNKKLVLNYCPVIINGTNEQKIFCLDVGVGKSTGTGLGCIKPTK